MILVRMNAAGRDQPNQMASAAARFELFDQGDERGRTLDFAAGNGFVDARQVLDHHAAGADIEMADFGIAHLAVRQADVLARSVENSVRTALPEAAEIRCLSLANGVIARVVAPAPAIQNDQHHRPLVLHHKTPLVDVRPVLRIAATSSIAIA